MFAFQHGLQQGQGPPPNDGTPTRSQVTHLVRVLPAGDAGRWLSGQQAQLSLQPGSPLHDPLVPGALLPSLYHVKGWQGEK